MLRKQMLILAGMAAAVAVIALVWQWNPQLGVALPADDPAARLAFATRWLAVPGLTLLLGIAAIANRRFFTPDAIDGGEASASRFLDITLRYNRNTLEQAVLAAIAWEGLALALPQGRLGLIPILAILFAAGRITFWIGYLLAPWARAFGLGLTFYPTVAAYLWLAGRLLS
ncbi:MAG TPA: MAPEG family protein [Rhizomicrobium sp.]|nr:MAPEG family protein [Rhizomicrobium sp.]